MYIFCNAILECLIGVTLPINIAQILGHSQQSIFKIQLL